MEYYNKLEDPFDEENDMLDLALGLTETCVSLLAELQVFLNFETCADSSFAGPALAAK